MPNQFTRPWTKADIKFIKDNIGKLTYEKMGRVIGRSYSSIQSKVRYLPFQKKIKKHDVNFDYFKKWTPGMAYVLGFTAADGNICHSGNAHTLHIASDDMDVIKKIKKDMGYSGPIYERPRLNGKTSYSLRICDQTIFNDLKNLGITEKKSLTLDPKVNLSFIKDFLRGFFDGDGSVYFRRGNQYKNRLSAVFYTASAPMANFIHSNLKQILVDQTTSKIQSRLKRGRAPYYSISLGHKASARLFNVIYKNTRIFMARKYNKFLQGITNDN